MADPTILSYKIQDKEGVETAHSIFVDGPSSGLLSDLQDYAAAYATVLDGITDGIIVSGRIDVPMSTLSGLKTTAGPNDVEKTGLFNFANSSSRYKIPEDVPAVAQAVIASGRIDLSNTNVQAWITFLETTSHTISAVSKFLLVLQNLVDAVLTFRKHRKLLIRRSFETP